MTDQHDAPQLRRLGLEPADLDGHTIEELTDYLDAGRVPSDPSIEGSAGCQLALDALERLRSVTGQLIAADAARDQRVEESWVDGILSGIVRDARAGRRIPLGSARPGADLGITEGAVRGLVRSAENALPGILVGRCRLEGDVTEAGAPIRVAVDVSVPYGDPIPRLAERLRAVVAERLRSHAELNVVGVDIRVRDVRDVFPGKEEEDR